MRVRTARDRLAFTIGAVLGAAVATVILAVAFGAPVEPIVVGTVAALALFWLLSLRQRRS